MISGSTRILALCLVLLSAACADEPANLNPGEGLLDLRIVAAETGEEMPGKVLFFRDGEPFHLARESAGRVAIRKNTLYTLAGHESLAMPAGRYELWAGRGMEYGIDRQTVRVVDGRRAELELRLARVIDTEGFVSGDMHLHTLTHSGHGDSNMEERIVSCIGEGLEWAVATDHNTVTDYDTVITAFGAEGRLAATCGNEVSSDFGHFNSYPLVKGSQAVAMDPSDANVLLKLIRAETESVVIQVNHPRYEGIDYFTIKGLDDHLAETDDPHWSWDFDAVEILNENSGYGWKATARNPISVRQDWYNLLNGGRRITGVGNSDSHDVERMLAGVPRNYIVSPTDDPGLIDEAVLAENIKRGRVSVATGIFVQMWVNGIQARSDTTLSGGKARVRLRVQAPDWVSCDSVTLIGNGGALKTFAVADTRSALRLDETFELELAADTWLHAIAEGDESLAPMIHDAPGPVMPLGFTNPVWIDADGDGRFTSLKERAADLVEHSREDIDALVARLAEREQMIPFALGALQRVDPPAMIRVMEALLPDIGVDLKLYFIRQLKASPSTAASSLLASMNATETRPLVRLALSRRPDRGEAAGLSEGQAEELRMKLSGLGDADKAPLWRHLNRLPPGSMPELVDGEALDPEQPLRIGERSYPWRSRRMTRGGHLEYPAFRERAAYLVLVEYWSRYNAEVPFLIESGAPHRAWVNGKPFLDRPRGCLASFASEVTHVPMTVGKNQVLVAMECGPEAFELLMEPLDEERWLNPKVGSKQLFPHAGLHARPEIEFAYTEKYRGGENALTDGWRASPDYMDGFWMGFEEVDMSLEFEFDPPISISEVSAGFLQDLAVWIWLPRSMEVMISTDGESYRPAGIWKHAISERRRSAFVEEARVEFPAEAVRGVKVIARGVGRCPEWHVGAGGKAWIFCDEISLR